MYTILLIFSCRTLNIESHLFDDSPTRRCVYVFSHYDLGIGGIPYPLDQLPNVVYIEKPPAYVPWKK